MPDKTCKYSTDITAAWAVRYLERLERPFDDWQIDCFRRGCSFLAKGVTEGAISSWDLMHLPDEDRRNAYSGPQAVLPFTRQEVDRLGWMLAKIIRRDTSGRDPLAPGEGSNRARPM